MAAAGTVVFFIACPWCGVGLFIAGVASTVVFGTIDDELSSETSALFSSIRRNFPKKPNEGEPDCIKGLK